MALQDTRKSKSAVAYEHEYAFLSIQDMQDRIPAILGINLSSLIRVDRFEGTDKARLHYRELSYTNDGTGVPVKVRLNPDPTITTETDMFANIAINIPFMKPGGPGEEDQMVYWDGSAYQEISGGGGLVATYDEIQEHIPFGANGFYPSTVVLNLRDLEVESAAFTNLIIDGRVKKFSYDEIQTMNNTWTHVSGEPINNIELMYDDGKDTDGKLRVSAYIYSAEQPTSQGTFKYNDMVCTVDVLLNSTKFEPAPLVFENLSTTASTNFDIIINGNPIEFDQNIENQLLQNFYLSKGTDQGISVTFNQGNTGTTGRWQCFIRTTSPTNVEFEGSTYYNNKYLTIKGNTLRV